MNKTQSIWRRIFYVILPLAGLTLATVACSSDDEEYAPKKAAEASGTWTDPRDNEEYHWVRYGRQEWMAENFRYDLADNVNSTIYTDADESEKNPGSTRNLARYGRLYTLQGAKTACPDGWRLPTDDDWQQLEQTLGMSAGEAASEGWRGNISHAMLSLYDSHSDLNLLLGGYFFAHTPGVSSGWRHMGTYGYYWTATADTLKEGTFYYVRKLTYTKPEVCRMSMEPTGYKLNVRYVRDAN
jgi:uncharacterized protein (TIGR02145 family)